MTKTTKTTPSKKKAAVAATAIVAGTAMTIPLNQLALSEKNARKAEPTGIEELALNILAVGLLQNLVVVQAPDETLHLVCAGGRRLRALQWLSANGKIPEDFPVRCIVVATDDEETVSLVENYHREAMHPADELDAFQRLIDAGKTVEEVAASFGVTPGVVRRRLRLSVLSPRLMEDFRAGNIRLDQMMALSVSDNHELQELAWYEASEYDQEPDDLRDRLTFDSFGPQDRLVKFVTAEAYLAAGGAADTDLFAQTSGDGVFLKDGLLLEKLAVEKLAAKKAEVEAEGWRWVTVAPRLEQVRLYDYQRTQKSAREASEAEQAKIDTLEARYEELEALMQNADDGMTNEQYEALSDEQEKVTEELDVLRATLHVYSADAKLIAGAIVGVNGAGLVEVHRGLVTKEDVAALRKAAAGDSTTAATTLDLSTAPKAKPEHSEALTRRLTSHRTLAMQLAMATQPHVALAMTVHRMVTQTLMTSYSDLPLGVSLTKPGQMRQFAPELPGTKAGEALHGMIAGWQTRLPHNNDQLLAALLDTSQDELVKLLAICAALTVDVVTEGANSRASDKLAQLLKLDMRDWWSATAEGYFGSVSKAKTLAVVESVVPGHKVRLEKLKKGELVKEAEQLVAGSGWLPEPLAAPTESVQLSASEDEADAYDEEDFDHEQVDDAA